MKKTSGAMVVIMVVAIIIGPFIMVNYATTGDNSRDGRFIAYDNGTVLDTKTNLMWAAKDNGYYVDWADAKSYCEKYRVGGYADWRMPTHDELAGLYDKTENYESVVGGSPVHLTKLIRLTSFIVWGYDINRDKSASFSFYSGKRLWDKLSGNVDSYVLPVRSGK